MEENSDIDKLAMSAMKLFNKDVPENAWNQLDAELDKKQALIYKKKANNFRLLSIGLALLLFFFVMYHYLSPVPGLITMNNAGNSQREILSDNAGTIEKSTMPNSLPVYAVDKKQVTNKIAGEKESKATVNVSEKATVAKTMETGLGRSNQASKKPSVTGVEILPVLHKPEATPKHWNKRSSRYLGKEEGTSIKSSSNENTSHSKNKIVNVKEEQLTPEEFETEATSSTEAMVKRLPAAESTDSETGNQFAAPVPAASDPAFHTEATVINPSTPDSTIKKNSCILHFSIALFYSPEHAWINLQDNNSGDNLSSYYAREKFESAFTTGVLLQYDLNSKWSIVSGCQYSEKKFSMTYSTIYVGYGFDGGLHYQYPTSWGIVEKPNTSNKVLHEGDVLNKTINCSQVVSFISIPLIARFKITGRRLEWYATSGVTANMLNHVFMDLTIGTTTSRIERNIDGLKKINYGYLAGTGLKLKLFRGLGVFVEPVLRGSINSITKNTPVNSYPWSLGLNAGIQYKPMQ